MDAFVAVSGVLRRLSNFDRFHMDASRQREEAARTALLAQLSELPCRNSARAFAVITLADAAAESVGERALLWALLSVSPERPVTQQGWRVDDRHYFSDLYLPSQRAILEFDGAAKMGTTEAEFFRSRREQMQRQLGLERAGLKVLRYQWNDLLSPDQLRKQLRNQLGLPLTGIPQLHRRLWAPNHHTRAR
ncbi:MAG: hypothetical protein Q3999_00340 [Buchananella hordeovulneris]|nr:hypothetical protein [Buchananella hordeovulneris]